MNAIGSAIVPADHCSWFSCDCNMLVNEVLSGIGNVGSAWDMIAYKGLFFFVISV